MSRRLPEILKRLDNSETPMDELAAEVKEAGALITSIHATLKSASQGITSVFEGLEKQNAATSAKDGLVGPSGREVAF